MILGKGVLIIFSIKNFKSQESVLTLYFKVLSMKTEKEYIKDLSEIRLMMERSTKFLSLTGLSGILAGIYALAGAYFAYRLFYVNPGDAIYNTLPRLENSDDILNLAFLAFIVLLLAVGTAIYLSSKKATKNNEILWNPVSRRLVINMGIPLVTGGIFILIIISKGIFELIAPLTLIFYGLALINASEFTFKDLNYLGMVFIILGLVSSYFPGLGLLFWAIGFGLMHIIYGIYMHLRYEK